MKKILVYWPLIVFVPLVLVTMQGCAGCRNDIASRGGLVGSYAGDYIVISQSGGLIMDCWKLTDVYVESVSGSDGWRFKKTNGDVVFIGGDAKIVRVEDKSTMDKYHEYHMEFEDLTYREKFGGLAEKFLSDRSDHREILTKRSLGPVGCPTGHPGPIGPHGENEI